jgi:hypothetical protein
MGVFPQIWYPSSSPLLVGAYFFCGPLIINCCFRSISYNDLFECLTHSNLLANKSILSYQTLHTHSEFCLAKYKRAERYRDTHAVRQANGNSLFTEGSRFDLSCSLSDFRKYGPGVYLFFRFIRVLAVMFLLLFLVSVPSMASNYSGKGLEIYGNADSTSLRIMKLSLANQRYYEWSRLTPD